MQNTYPEELYCDKKGSFFINRNEGPFLQIQIIVYLQGLALNPKVTCEYFSLFFQTSRAKSKN